MVVAEARPRFRRGKSSRARPGSARRWRLRRPGNSGPQRASRRAPGCRDLERRRSCRFQRMASGDLRERKAVRKSQPRRLERRQLRGDQLTCAGPRDLRAGKDWLTRCLSRAGFGDGSEAACNRACECCRSGGAPSHRPRAGPQVRPGGRFGQAVALLQKVSRYGPTRRDPIRNVVIFFGVTRNNANEAFQSIKRRPTSTVRRSSAFSVGAASLEHATIPPLLKTSDKCCGIKLGRLAHWPQIL